MTLPISYFRFYFPEYVLKTRLPPNCATGFLDSLHNASLFCPRSGPKSCRCAAQTPADTGFLQAFDPIRGGSRPLVLPLQKRTLFLQAGFFDKLESAA